MAIDLAKLTTQEILALRRDSKTMKNRADNALKIGVHPATARPLLKGKETCKTCQHKKQHRHGFRRDYWKCSKAKITYGPSTDIVLSWPACVLWEKVG